jgi:phosphoribosylformylglycinamidine synthase
MENAFWRADMNHKPNVLILTGYGLNCDMETAHAFERVGAQSHRVHINALIDGSVSIDSFHIMVFGGGFSWGDDHGAGVIQAVRMKTHLGENLLAFIDQGNLIIGICNGFQTLVNMGLLPGFDSNYQKRSVALIHNDCGNFRDQWVSLTINPASPCIWTQGLNQLDLPVRHGEGKFYAETDVIDRLGQDNQIVFQYSKPDGHPAEGQFPHNPNGSLRDIAGICDPTGRILGLMPHPEAYHHYTHHPDWTRRLAMQLRQKSPVDTEPVLGIRLFENAIRYLAGN